MDVWDHEGNALSIYRKAGADPGDPPGPHGLARLLKYAIRYDCCLLLGGAERAVIRGERVIFVQRGLTALVEGVRIYHEIAEDHLAGLGVGEEDLERAADELAYHLRMPRAAFRGLVADVGYDLAALAEPWPSSQTGAALRLLEVTDTPGVVITTREVRVRGPEWGWPPVGELRRLVRANRLPDGVKRLPISDRRGAALLLAS